jgi:hypothetical protein
MNDCDCLIHPFQNDPGTSQRQRVIDELLAGAAKIDARTLADLLDYFVQLSRHINYYDLTLTVSDWQPFFSKSIPFTLASIINYPLPVVESNFSLYNSLFEKKPTSTSLQLTTWYIYYRFIHKINSWHLTLKGSGLPAEAKLEVLIRNKLQDPVKQFIQSANAAVKAYGIKRIEFTELFDNKVWNIDQADMYSIDTSFSKGTNSKFKKINNLYGEIKALYPVFLDVVKTLSAEAEKNLEKSFTQLKDEFQQNHKPHLALLFAFLNIFRQLQDDLNKYTRKHLDFFYKDILKFTTRDANPDKAFVIFEIQKQLEKYLIKKGLKVKDGKDEKKQEILFSLEDEIVVNKTQVAEKRVLYLNNQNIYGITYNEGVYMAPDISMADGIDKPFTDEQPKNFPTLGNKESKYFLPGTQVFKPYPNARLGFILASPVLLLNEGTRKVTITLQCELDENTCKELASMINPEEKGCCNGNDHPLPDVKKKVLYPDFLPSSKMYKIIKDHLNQTYYYISEDNIQELIKKGIGKDLIGRLRDNFLTDKKTICYCETETKKFDNYLDEFIKKGEIIISNDEKTLISSVIKKRKPLKLLFSGEKDWIEPNLDDTSFSISPVLSSNKFSLIIDTLLKPDLPAVTFYNGENLKEDFDTTLPLVKIELDDHFKLDYLLTGGQDEIACCLNKKFANTPIPISLYYFFRNVKVSGNNVAGSTQIDVQVCGLKSFVVQNEESVMDVNGPIYPFGTRPDVANFDINHYPPPIGVHNIGPSFYIGSKEIFCKKWNDFKINLNWKDRPDNFNDYYNAYVVDTINNTYGLDIKKFLISISVLQDGIWNDEGGFRNLFESSMPIVKPTFTVVPIICADDILYAQGIQLDSDYFPPQEFTINKDPLTRLDVRTRNGFIKITLRDQDFFHKDYAFVLARQMMAFGKLPNDHVEGAIYFDTVPPPAGPIVISTDAMLTALNDSGSIAAQVNSDVAAIESNAGNTGDDILSGTADPIRDILRVDPPNRLSLINGAAKLDTTINQDVINILNALKKYAAIIPNEPWTPLISNMALDYTASATAKDISLIHLYPFTGTYKKEEIQLTPTLFPTFCDEGTLFLGLKDLVPGNNLNILFQLAEATSDSESEKEPVFWHFLYNNIWKQLRTGFEVLEDGTKNLTTSGIIQFALPENMTKENSVMPKGLHWIKASIAKNSKAVSETIGIHAQAILVTFTNEAENDKLRLAKALPAESITKLEIADASVKSVAQPYESFGGLIPETEGPFYVRVSERLRHKGRAIQAFDYERLVLEAFPQLFKVKCINHSFALDAHQYINDYPYAPGYIILAVIPDLNKLKAGNSYEPKVPVSIIEDIDSYIRKRTSPFVRFRAMNPRYEKVSFCIRVQLVKGKDENYYREKLRQDIREFLAPWAVGIYDKLTFGQCVYRSEIIRLLETRDYIDFITELKMDKEPGSFNKEHVKICPDTPRSILIAGDIDVCIENPTCESWSQDDKCKTVPESILNYCKEG